MVVQKSSNQSMFWCTIFVVASFLAQQVAVEAARPLEGDFLRLHRASAEAASHPINPIDLLLLGQSLPRAKTPSSGASSCTYVPTRGKRRCTSEVHVAAPRLGAGFRFAANGTRRNQA